MWKSLFHVSLFVNDIEKSVDYYEKIGLEVLFGVGENEPWDYYLRIAKGQYLELQPVHAPNPHAHPEKAEYHENQTIWHFSLETDNIAETIRDFQEKGIGMWRDPEKEEPVLSVEDVLHGPDGCLILWLVDPDGNPIEVMEQPGETMQRKYDHD